ncbi:unnamed protein product [Boreogadus saida]
MKLHFRQPGPYPVLAARGASLGARPGRCGMMWCQGAGAGGWLGIMDGGRLQQLLRGRGRGHYLRSYLRA